MMTKYIDAEKLKRDYAWFGDCSSEQSRRMKATFDRYVDGQPTADVVPKEEIIEFITNKLTKQISERIIQFLEENYEIIPKKPVLVWCKECKFWKTKNDPDGIEFDPEEMAHYCDMDGMISRSGDFCSHGEMRTDDAENEKVDITKMRVDIEKNLRILHK